MATQFSLSASYRFTASIIDENGSFNPQSLLQPVSHPQGVLPNQFDRGYSVAPTIVDNATPFVIDLNGGGLLMANQEPFSVVKVGLIVVQNLDAANRIIMRPEAGSPFADWITSATAGVRIGKSATFILYNPLDPYIVTPATNDKLQFETLAGAAISSRFRFMCGGVSA